MTKGRKPSRDYTQVYEMLKEGKPVAEIAQLTGIPMQTVRSKLDELHGNTRKGTYHYYRRVEVAARNVVKFYGLLYDSEKEKMNKEFVSYLDALQEIVKERAEKK